MLYYNYQVELVYPTSFLNETQMGLVHPVAHFNKTHMELVI